MSPIGRCNGVLHLVKVMLRSTLQHPKLYELIAQLGCSRPEAIGYLTLLWDFTSTVAPAGNIGKWKNGAIAKACEWEGDPDVFVEAMVAAGWIDHDAACRLLVHDWPHHCQRWVKAKLAKSGEAFVEATTEATVEATTDREKTTLEATVEATDTRSLPLPSPSPSFPSVSTNVDTCGDPAESPPEFGFPTSHGGTWYLPTRKLDEYRDTYGDKLDVKAELRKARQWLRDNKQRRKTPGGMKAFLTRWLNKASDKVQGNGQETNEQILARLAEKRRKAEEDGKHDG